VTYTYYDYLDLPFGAAPARIEAAFMSQLERFAYGSSDTGQDMSGLLAMVHSAYKVPVGSGCTESLRRDACSRSRDGGRRAQGDARPARNRGATAAACAGLAA
jgi:hypothetical protein